MKSALKSHASDSKYSPLAIILHWLMAVLIIGTFSFGVYMTDLPFSPMRIKQFNWHKWAGISILALACIRLLWRLTHKPPALPPGPPWQATASSVAHAALYALFFIVPLIGWAYSSAAGFPVVWFGLIALPDFVSANKELADTLKQVHKIAAVTMAVLVLLHVAAAMKHHFVDKDGLMARMWPSK